MKHTRKISIVLVLMMVLMMTLAIIPASAATPTKLYLQPGTNWNQANARFAAYFFGNGDKWVSMTKVAGETNLYEVEVPAGYPKVIFCRMNPSTSANNWNNKWNQSGDLTIPTNGNNKFTVANSSWDGATATWGKYTPKDCQHSATDALLSNTATCTADGKATYHCNLCNQDYTKDAAYLNHDFVDGDCSRCDVVLNTVYYDNANGWANVHFYAWSDAYNYNSWPGTAMTKEGNVWVASIPSDCTQIIFNNGEGGEGNQTADLTIPTDGNNFYAAGAWTTYNPGCQHTNTEPVAEVPATCGTAGTTAGVKCSDCPEILEGCKEIPATGEHTFDKGACTVCGAINLEDTVTIYFENNWNWTGLNLYYWYGKDNTPNAVWPGAAITSEPVGKNEYGASIYAIEVPVAVGGVIINGHDSGKEGEGANNQTPDIKPAACTCYYLTWDEKLNEGAGGNAVGTYAYGHTYGEAVVVDPTCEEPGYTTKTCTVCGAVEKSDETEALGHNFVNFVEIVIVDGQPLVKYDCERCDVTENLAVFTFRGGSIRYLLADGETEAPTDSVALRFGYQIDVNVLEYLTAWGWDYRAVADDNTVTGSKTGKYITDAGITNLVFTNIALNRLPNQIFVTFSMTLEIDGETYVITDAEQVRTTQEVLERTAASSDDPAAEYAQKVLDLCVMPIEIAYIPSKKENA